MRRSLCVLPCKVRGDMKEGGTYYFVCTLER
jgi:hypothetical protein